MELDRLKRTVARVEVGGKPNGTAFLVTPTRVATALHVLDGNKEAKLIFVEWAPADRERTAKRTWLHPGGDDVALLDLDRACPGDVQPLPWSATAPKLNDRWMTFGFPAQVPDGHPLSSDREVVSDPQRLVEESGLRILQLYTPDASYDLRGFSGAPCVIQDVVVGVMTYQLRRALPNGTETVSRRPELNTLFALPITLLGQEVPTALRAPPSLDDRLRDLLEPLAFDTEISRHVAQFRGRGRVFDQVDAWLKDAQGARALWLIGTPGTGKSAIASVLCAPPRSLAAARHFFVYGDSWKADPSRCLCSIAGQLAKRIPTYAAQLNQSSARIEKVLRDSEASLLTRIDTLFAEPLARLSAPPDASPVVILIDALDEATIGTTNELAQSMGKLLDALPRWLRLIATFRPDPELAHLRSLAPCIELTEATNAEDIREYLQTVVVPTLPPEAVEAIARRSEGAFLYVTHIIDEIRQNHLSLDRLGELPQGLSAAYKEAFQRRFSAERYEKEVAPVLGVLAAAYDFPSREMLRKIFSAPAAATGGKPLSAFSDTATEQEKRFFRSLEALFSTAHDVLRPFHKSVLDWLMDGDRSGDYVVERGTGQKTLAEYCWRAYQHWITRETSSMPTEAFLASYAARYGVRHLLECRRYADAVTLLGALLVEVNRSPSEDDAELAPAPGTVVRNDISRLARWTSIALGTEEIEDDEARRINARVLARLLQSLYMTEPLYGGIQLIIKYHRDEWPDILNGLLERDDYVLRHTISEAMAADFIAGAGRDVALAEKLKAIYRLLEDEDVNRRELGGYTVALIYAEKPALIEQKYLNVLAQGETYAFRSILGDMLLGLALQDFGKKAFKRLEKVALVSQTTRFWNPIWEFNRMDVSWLSAAKLFLQSEDRSREPPVNFSQPAREAYESMRRTEAARGSLLNELGSSDDDEAIRRVLKSYYSLATDRERKTLRSAEKALARSRHLKAFCEVLFAHPVWAVTEDAASVLASIVESDVASSSEDAHQHGATRASSLQIVRDLFDSREWRVTYGAAETAFQIRFSDDNRLFTEALKRFHKEPPPLLRGNCAENLAAWILDSSAWSQRELIDEFGDILRYWLEDPDQDCWVLDHLHRFFSSMMKVSEGPEACEPLLRANVSRLLQGSPAWYTLDRQSFLRRIEEARRHLVA